MAPLSVKISFRYGSHLPVLLQVMEKTKGDVLELGAGFFSTPTLHWLCTLQKRNMLTIESNKRWHRWFSIYTNQYHQFAYVDNWEDAKIEKKWDVVLVDHSPDFRRIEEIRRLANFAKYIIIHDSNDQYSRNFHYEKIYNLFKYKFVFEGAEPSTTVLSNFTKLDDLVSI